MGNALVRYLSQRPDAATFLVPYDLARALEELFPQWHTILPQPYKIFFADETHPPLVGFPVAEAPVLKELDTRADRWISDEVAAVVARDTTSREKAQLSFQVYVTHLMRVAENALVSNLLNDYHAVFWLAHSFDLSRHFSSIPRRVNSLDTQIGRTQGDALKYRIYGRWAAETREQMAALAGRTSAMLDGEEQRGLQFFKLLQEDVLLLTEEFIGPDLRELRSYLHGYLRKDPNAFRDTYDRLRNVATDLLQKDRTFRAAFALLGANPEHGITPALLLDTRFQAFLFEHPALQNQVPTEEREQFALVARRVREFAVLNQLRRGIVWMTGATDGEILSADRRNPSVYSRSTRPLDFGRPGVVDPMVHRFGLIYDISAFSETLGNIRRGGGKEEIRSYRQMLLFQRRMENIAERQSLQFEKFLGDGAFYTTRRALRLIRAAVEIQRFYSEMKRKGFAFNKGLRIAVNYGYYRLLPMKTGVDAGERITEFYGPGIVELSRLTTGKANKEIDDVAALLIAQGYDEKKVRQFFAPLSQGVDTVDHSQQAREFYSYVNANGHLINEGIVGSMWFLQELSNEIAAESLPLFRLRAQFGTYIGFAPSLPGVEYVGLRLLGMVALKGLDKLDVGEITPFGPGEVEATPLDAEDPLWVLLRQEFHNADGDSTYSSERIGSSSTSEHAVDTELVICMPVDSADPHDEVLIGEWDPLSDDIHRALRMPRGDFQRLFSLKGELTPSLLDLRKQSVSDLYHRLSERGDHSSARLADFRLANTYDTYVLGDIVEKL
jgi:hypothetical protein